MKANCFPCSLAAPGEVREVSTGLPAHFRASPPPRPLRGPPPPPRTPTATGRCPRRVEWGWGRGVGAEAGGGRRFVAAAVSCRDATAVGERGTCARRLPRPPRASAPSVRRGRLAPSPHLSALAGWVPVSARPKKNPETRSEAPPKRRLAARQPARWHLSGGRGRELSIKEAEFSPVFPIARLPVAGQVSLQGEATSSLGTRSAFSSRACSVGSPPLCHLSGQSLKAPLTQNLSPTSPEPFPFFANVGGEWDELGGRKLT